MMLEKKDARLENLIRLGDQHFSQDEIDRDTFRREVDRERAMSILREPVSKRPFPSKSPALDYAQMREAAAQARDTRIRKWKGENVEGATSVEMSVEEIRRAAYGRQEYFNWYGQIVEEFDVIASLICLLCETDKALVEQLVRRGNELHEYYRGELRSGSIPHLPHHRGDKYRNVLVAWEKMRECAS